MGKLIDLTVSAFDAEVASASPAPGGGSAAALAGSVAAALVAMVCHLSLGRSDVVATDEELSKALEQSEQLRRRLLELVDEDTAAFGAIMDAVRMPKADEAQRAPRRWRKPRSGPRPRRSRLWRRRGRPWRWPPRLPAAPTRAPPAISAWPSSSPERRLRGLC